MSVCAFRYEAEFLAAYEQPEYTHADYFQKLTVTQLQQLCKAGKLGVSATKPELVARIKANDSLYKLGQWDQDSLKWSCQQRLLVVGGNKCDLLLRILYHDYGTGTAKRAATETIVDEDGTTKEVVKKRAIIYKPKRLYERVQKKIHAVTQKQYQTKQGCKQHSPDVFFLMFMLLQEQCIDNKLIQTDPLLAYDMAKAIFQAADDHWGTIHRTRYGTEEFEEALDVFATVLRAAKNHLSPQQNKEVVCMLIALEQKMFGGNATNTYCCDKVGNPGPFVVNYIENAIKVVQPGYVKEPCQYDDDDESDECESVADGRGRELATECVVGKARGANGRH
jgi:hypothetical protein